jgi:hypothetical protein
MAELCQWLTPYLFQIINSVDSLQNHFQPMGSEWTDDRFLFSLSKFYRKIQKDFLGYFWAESVFVNSYG